MPDFPDLAALNAWLEQRCMWLWHEIPHGALSAFSVNVPFTCQASGTFADIWVLEQAALISLPPAFDGFVEHSKCVSPIHCPAGDACIAERDLSHEVRALPSLEGPVRLRLRHQRD
jgi:hypothetical protein